MTRAVLLLSLPTPAKSDKAHDYRSLFRCPFVPAPASKLKTLEMAEPVVETVFFNICLKITFITFEQVSKQIYAMTS